MTTARQSTEQPHDIVSLLEQASPAFAHRFDAKAIEKLKHYGFSMDEIYRIVAPRRTLARRVARKEPLTVSESDSVLRVLRICEIAERVFDEWQRADGWLREPSLALNGVVPISLLQSETGARLVEDELLRIEHGIF
ncbi:antitoxin Xre/MbcA/ParS toxin-binding domain-containing protein [Rhizobium sp. 18065]|uniref:type II RES/Xre toxin-antitoxin system antitoxin n=1 Tax=Rhizobium sp. 18065 TaxID=2681411 RepID=UPI00135CD57E|nr:antitoxin Xre/MbcA/ParS toxin-binding domain-containing protein [Rhizobium sp. 18065]